MRETWEWSHTRILLEYMSNCTGYTESKRTWESKHMYRASCERHKPTTSCEGFCTATPHRSGEGVPASLAWRWQTRATQVALLCSAHNKWCRLPGGETWPWWHQPATTWSQHTSDKLSIYYISAVWPHKWITYQHDGYNYRERDRKPQPATQVTPSQ